MKRFLSLLLCISLLMSLNVGTISVSASTEEVTMIEKTNVTIDMTDVTGITSVRGDFSKTAAVAINGTKQHWMLLPKHPASNAPAFAVSEDTTTFGYSVMKMVFAGGYAQLMPNGKITDSGTSATPVTGKKVVFEGKAYQTQASVPKWKPNNGTEYWLGESVKANTWYNFEITVNLNSNMVMKYTEILSAASSAEGATPHTITTNCAHNKPDISYIRYNPSISAGETVYFDDFKIWWEDAPYEKAQITEVGTDDVVTAGQNVLPLELSNSISDITEEHIKVRNVETDEVIEADSIVVSDGAKHTVDVTLKSNLASWAEYELTIDPLAFGEGAKQRTGEGQAVAVTKISRLFETTKPTFATKGFDIQKNGNKLEATGLVVNTSGTPKDMKLIFSSFTSDGRPANISVTNYDAFNDATGDYLTAETNIAGADKFNFFVMDNWADKTALLGVNSWVDSSGITASQAAVSCGTLSTPGAALVVNKLDHATKTLKISIDTRENEIIDGILLVYKDGETLSDGNKPDLIRTLSTAADGTVKVDIPLSESLPYGEYTAEFASQNLAGSLECSFNHYTPAELLEVRRAEILTAARSAFDEESLKIAILGLNDSGIKVNSNFETFGTDADMSDYEAVLNKTNVFTRMLSTVSVVANYDALVSLFETSADEQLQYEIANPTVMIERTTTVVDTIGKTLGLGNAGKYGSQISPEANGVRQRGVMFPLGDSNRNTVSVDSSTFDYPVIKYEYGKQNQTVWVQLKWTGEDGGFSGANLNKKVKVNFSGRTRYTVAGATPSWSLQSITSLAMPEALKKDTWYKFESVLDLTKGSNNFTVTYTEETANNPHVVTATTGVNSSKFTQYRISTGIGVGAGNIAYYSDLKLEYEDIPYEKAKLTSVGTAGVVEGGQNTVTFTLSQKIPELAKEHIKIKNKETNEELVADSIVQSDGAYQMVAALFASNLISWSEYELEIDPLAFGEGSVQRVNADAPTAVTSIKGEFTTTKPPFGAKPFVFTNAGDNLNAKALVANTTGIPKNMNFVFVSFDADGRLKAIMPTEHTGFVNSAGEYLEANASAEGTNKFNFFVIDDWTQRNQLFGANYNIDASGNYLAPEVLSSCEALSGSAAVIELGELDYENKKILVKLDTKEGKLTDGIIFVYKNGEVLSSGNLPSYAQSISTNADGRVEKEILLPASFTYGAYTVEFSSASLGEKVTKTFRYYSPDEILANKRNAILADAKVASDAQGLREVLIGVNSAGEQVNDNGDVFIKDTDMTNYQKNTNKLGVFERMLASVSSLANYDALVNLFESCASAQRADEVAAQKLQIVADAKSAVNAAGLMKVILGINDVGTKVNTNFEVISSNANLSVYNSLGNKAAVFTHMFVSSPYISSYSELISLFENAANTQKSKENVPQRPSSNNSSYGGSSTSMKETTSAPATDANQSGTASSSVFTDMSGHWAENYVEVLYKRGIMKGYEDGSFRGENSITRAELAKTLVETFEIAAQDGKTFGDVAASSWYAAYVASAASAGIVNGFEDGTFSPDKEVTRQDAVLMLYRAMSIGRKLPIGYTFFTDDLDISDYASGAIRTLGDLGIVGGNDKKQFLPNNSITRAEVATIICRAIDYIESH